MTSPSDTIARKLNALGEQYFATQHGYDPFNATLLGLTDFDDRTGDPGVAASAEAAESLAAIATAAGRIDTAGLDDAGRVDHAVLTALAHGAAADAHHSLWASNASAKGYVSRQALIFQAIPAMTTGDDESEQRFEQRLGGVAAFLTALGARYIEEAATGRIPTARGVTHAAEQLEGYLALPLSADILLTPTRPGTPARERATAVVRDAIRPAMAHLAERLRHDLLPIARGDDRVGIRYVPGGADGYAAAVARHTTTALTPEEIHVVGLEILEGLASEWAGIGERALGLTALPDIADRLRHDPRLRCESEAQIIGLATGALHRAQAAQDDWFPARELPDCVIEPINAVDAEHAAMAYYRPPAVDGSRPGAHCLLTTHPTERFRFEYEALAFHESVPGHHLQLATAQQLDLPRYRRHLDVEACSFNEGWGLYAESLADEMGLYSDDIARLGRLSFAALRACRLVIDTGLHAFGWSREQAVEFGYANTATTREHIENEVDRYICWPGQALAYQIGNREIRRLRDRCAKHLRADFDVREFHGVVLGHGAVPLPVLDSILARWTADRIASGDADQRKESISWT